MKYNSYSKNIEETTEKNVAKVDNWTDDEFSDDDEREFGGNTYVPTEKNNASKNDEQTQPQQQKQT